MARDSEIKIPYENVQEYRDSGFKTALWRLGSLGAIPAFLWLFEPNHPESSDLLIPLGWAIGCLVMSGLNQRRMKKLETLAK